MRILLTGAKGQLGRCFKERLPEHWELIASDSQTLNITDVHNVANMVKTFEPDLIINAAAYTAVDQAEHEKTKAFAINATGALNLALAAKDIGARLIHVSTDMVFNGEQQTPITAEIPPDPVNIYGQSKLAGELLVLNAHVNSLVLRTSWVFSEYGQNFVKTILKAGLTQPTLAVVNDQISCPTYAGDVAEVIIQLAQLNHIRGLWHFSGQTVQSKAEFAQHILHAAAQLDERYAKVSVNTIQSSDYPASATRPAYTVLDNQALQQQLTQPLPDTPVAPIIATLLPTLTTPNI